MAEDEVLETEGEESWDMDELLAEFEPQVEVAEKKADDANLKLAKGMKRLAEKQEKMEERERVEKLLADFDSKASDEEKELADVLLAGITDEGRVKKMIDLAKAKAKALKTDAEAEEEAEAADTEAAFAPVAGPSHEKVDDPWEPVLEQARRGDVHSSFLEFIADDDGFPAKLQERR
jgi:hypothetical protein